MADGSGGGAKLAAMAANMRGHLAENGDALSPMHPARASWLMTNCWRTNSHWHWCAARTARWNRDFQGGTLQTRLTDMALHPDGRAKAGCGRYRRRYVQAGTCYVCCRATSAAARQWWLQLMMQAVDNGASCFNGTDRNSWQQHARLSVIILMNWALRGMS